MFDGAGTAARASVAGIGLPARPDAVFLHTGWRTRGTWIWDALRRTPGTMAFYEPLHEALAGLTPAEIDRNAPDAWASGHPRGAPYFREYAALLTRAPGVPGFLPRFAYHDHFPDPRAPDGALAAWLHGLLEEARCADALPVLKFCRSQGRVAWMRRRFPGALHLVVLRHPMAQFASARAQWALGNPYFVVTPLMVLAANAEAPALARIAAALGVEPPVFRPRGPRLLREAALRHVARLDWEGRFRAFLAVWLAGALHALAHGHLAVDGDALAEGGPARQRLEAALAHAAGRVPDFAPAAAQPTPAADAAWQACLAEAWAAVESEIATWTTEQAGLLAALLASPADAARASPPALASPLVGACRASAGRDPLAPAWRVAREAAGSGLALLSGGVIRRMRRVGTGV